MYFDTVSPISERRKLNRPISQWILGAYILHGTKRMNYKWTTYQGARMDLPSELLVMSKVVFSWWRGCFSWSKYFQENKMKKGRFSQGRR